MRWLTGGYRPADVQSATWIWGLHADSHDFQSQTQDNGEIAARIFATHFAHLSIVAAWLSALFFAGGRFSNYEMWLVDPARVKPAAQIVYGSKALLQDTVNGETGGGSSAIRIRYLLNLANGWYYLRTRTLRHIHRASESIGSLHPCGLVSPPRCGPGCDLVQ